MSLEIKLDAIDKSVLDDLDRVAEKLERAGIAAKEARRKAREKIPATPSTPPTGPRSRLQDVLDWADESKSVGPLPYGQSRDLDDRVRRAWSSVARSEGVKRPFAPPPIEKPEKTTLDRIKDAVFSTRFGVGDDGKMSIMPLIGRTLQAFSGGKFATELTAITIALAAFNRAVSEGTEIVQKNSSGLAASGYSSSYGRGSAAAFFSGTDINSSANSLGERLRAGGIGASMMRSKGIVDYGPYTIDKVSNLTRAINVLAGIQDKSYRVMIARDLGLDAYLRLADASTGAREMALRAGSINATTNYERMVDSGKSAFDTVATATKDRFLTDLATRVNGLVSNPFQAASSMLTGNFRDAAMFAGMSGAQVLNPLDIGGGIGRWINELLASQLQGNSTAEKQIGATNELIRTMKDGNEILKGGIRSGGSTPAGWSYAMWEEGVKTRGNDLGSFK